MRAVRARAVRRPRAVADGLLPRVRGVLAGRRVRLGGDGRTPVDRDEGHRDVRLRRAEAAPAPGSGERSQARRVRADRARGGLGRIPPAVACGAPVRRLVAAQRREALHRQRLEGRRDRDLRPRGGRRQRPPHRADPTRHGRLQVGKRYDTMGLRGDLRHLDDDIASRQTSSASRATASRSRWRCSTTAA